MARQAKRHLRMVLPPAPWTRAMEDGSVQVDGLTWDAASDIPNAPERFVATAKEHYDVGENGLRRYVLRLLDGAPPTAIPVFFGRELMQRNLVVRADSPMSSPGDLAGKAIGSHLTVVSGTAAAVLMVLEQAYEIDLTSLELHMSAGDMPANRMGLTIRPGPGTDEDAFDQLARGDLDAVILTTDPRYWSLFGGDCVDEALKARPELRPLVSDPAVIADAYRRTGLYPISDLVVLRKELVEDDPEVPSQLVDAFAQANGLASRYRGPEEEALAMREVEMLGEDPHQYRLGANERLNLEAYTDFFYRMGAIERPLQPEELFAASTVR